MFDMFLWYVRHVPLVCSTCSFDMFSMFLQYVQHAHNTCSSCKNYMYLHVLPHVPCSMCMFFSGGPDGIIARSQSRREILAQFPLTGYISPKQPGNLECKNSEAPLVFAWDCGEYRDEMHAANQEVQVSMIRRQTSTMQPKQVHAGTRVYNSISRQFTC